MTTMFSADRTSVSETVGLRMDICVAEDLTSGISHSDGCGLATVWVRLSGELDRGHADSLERTLTQLRADGFPRVVLDLAGLRFFGAAGIGVVADAAAAFAACGGSLLLTRPTPVICRALAICDLTHLTTVTPLGTVAPTEPLRLPRPAGPDPSGVLRMTPGPWGHVLAPERAHEPPPVQRGAERWLTPTSPA